MKQAKYSVSELCLDKGTSLSPNISDPLSPSKAFIRLVIPLPRKTDIAYYGTR